MTIEEQVDQYAEAAWGFFNNEDYPRTIETASKGIALDGNSGANYLFRGLGHANLDNYEEALVDLTRGLALLDYEAAMCVDTEAAAQYVPLLSLCYAMLGSVLMECVRDEEALAAFRKAVEINPDNASDPDIGETIAELERRIALKV
jgi:tetratricopeptide (TPR) repeat protein